MNNTQARRVDDSHNPEPDLISTSPVIEGVEKLDDWLDHREIVVEELCPVGALENLYAERSALYLRRLDRVIGFENEVKIGKIEVGSENKRADSPESRVNRVLPDRSTLQTIIKYEAHLVRCLTGTMAELRRLQKERRQGVRDVNPAGHGADGPGVCEKEFDTKGSHGGSPSQIGSPVQNGSPSQKSSPSREITGAEMSIHGGRCADRAGGCQNQQIKDGSPGGSPSQTASPSQIGSPVQNGSPSQKSSPSREIAGDEMSIHGGRCADRAGGCQHQQIKDGSPGGSPSQIGSPDLKRSTARKHSTQRSVSRPKRASPIAMPPPLLASITNRRRLEEYTRGEIFERNLASATLNFAMIPCP